jgi:hypothetical protein
MYFCRRVHSRESGRYVHWVGGLQEFYLMPCCPSPAPGLGRFWAYSLCGWLIGMGPGFGGGEALETKKFQRSNNCFWLSALEPGHLVEFLPWPS